MLHKKINLRFRYFLYFFAFVAGWPCVFYLMGWLPHYTINYLVLFAIASVCVITKNKYKLPKPIFFLILFQVLMWLIYAVIHDFDTSYLTRIFLLLITYMFLELQMRYRYEFIKTYNFWVTFQAVAGSIGMLLVIFGILQPIFQFTQMDMRPGYFFGLFTTNTYSGDLVRNAGFYDEPGALAFWGIYALLINKLFVDNKKVEYLLVFGLISTLSMAYFIQLAIYFWAFYRKQQRKAVLVIMSIAATLVLISSFNETLNRSIFGRFEYDEQTGKLQGDNRSDLMEAAWEIFELSPIIGNGAKKFLDISSQRKQFVGANAFVNLAQDGLIGQIIVWSPFFLLFAFRKKHPKYGWVAFILILGYLQRPYDCAQLLYPLMTFTVVLQSYLTVNNIRGPGSNATNYKLTNSK